MSTTAAALQMLTHHSNNTNTMITTTSSESLFETAKIELPKNYSILINQLERLALGRFDNLSLDHKEVEIAVSGGGSANVIEQLQNAGLHTPSVHYSHHSDGVGNDGEYTKVVSDIWIGVILTLLIVSVIFFICSCFLYHKFQQWKNAYPANQNEPTVEICRHYSPDFECESLPSYTIVSGLPTYDDALEEFRKAGIILTPQTMVPIIKIFEADNKDANLDSSGINNSNDNSGDNISLSSTCTCGNFNLSASNTTLHTLTPHNSTTNLNLGSGALTPPQVIELSPDQLAQLSQKRLSLQIAFNGMAQRRNSRPRIDLCRQVNRNNLLRQNVGLDVAGLPQIHRSTSSNSLTLERHLHHLQHRGSLC